MHRISFIITVLIIFSLVPNATLAQNPDIEKGSPEEIWKEFFETRPETTVLLDYLKFDNFIEPYKTWMLIEVLQRNLTTKELAEIFFIENLGVNIEKIWETFEKQAQFEELRRVYCFGTTHYSNKALMLIQKKISHQRRAIGTHALCRKLSVQNILEYVTRVKSGQGRFVACFEFFIPYSNNV